LNLKRAEKSELAREIEMLKSSLPKEFHWIIQLLILKAKGYVLKLVYRRNNTVEECDHLKYFELDSERQSYVPVIPDEVKVYRHELGKGWVLHKVFRGMGRSDPPIDVALEIFEVSEKI